MLSLMQSLSMIQWFYKRYLSMNDCYKGVSKFLNAEILTQLLKTKNTNMIKEKFCNNSQRSSYEWFHWHNLGKFLYLTTGANIVLFSIFLSSWESQYWALKIDRYNHFVTSTSHRRLEKKLTAKNCKNFVVCLKHASNPLSQLTQSVLQNCQNFFIDN